MRKSKRNRKGERIENSRNRDEVKRRSDKAKVLTNDGELRKAYATTVQRGVAPATNDILEQLKTNFPKRKNTVR